MCLTDNFSRAETQTTNNMKRQRRRQTLHAAAGAILFLLPMRMIILLQQQNHESSFVSVPLFCWGFSVSNNAYAPRSSSSSSSFHYLDNTKTDPSAALHPPQRRRQRQALFSSSQLHLSSHDNDKNDDDTTTMIKETKKNEIGLVTPYEILYPETFYKQNHNNDDPPPRTGTGMALSLFRCLDILQESVQRIIDYEQQPQDHNNDDGDGWLEEVLRDPTAPVLRIEHAISHTVDPLCWLHAQTTTTTQKNQKNDLQYPHFYFATAEGTLETATLGAARQFTNITTTSSSSNNNNESSLFYEFCATLPPRAHLYGGQRFDPESTPSQEWQGFGSAVWMLPGIELRQEQQEANHNGTSSRKIHRTIAVHLVRSNSNGNESFLESAQHILRLLQTVTDRRSPSLPPTTLPPVLRRDSSVQNTNHNEYHDNDDDKPSSSSTFDGQELYERGVSAALERLAASNETTTSKSRSSSSPLEKVVLARRMDLIFGDDCDRSNPLQGLDILRKWKFATQPGGHVFYLQPSNDAGAFFGCTPERLFAVSESGVVTSEALAGTRPRGSTQELDAALSRDLFASPKDQAENTLTGTFISNAMKGLQSKGWMELSQLSQASESSTTTTVDGSNNNSTEDHLRMDSSSTGGGRFFVRRLRHLQHICQRFQGQLTKPEHSLKTIEYLLSKLHPTPAVCGLPQQNAMEFIREHETVGFDRGFYSGPIGFVGRDSAEIVVALRSGLLTRSKDTHKSKVSVYAGAGIVPGSTVQGEWAETSYKLAVVSSIFPQSPITLQSAVTPNVAWSTAFIEELIRNDVTQFYICPGSRSTPLVAAVAKAVRSSVGLVQALSIHDERGAGFRAIGYGRATGRPAVVITSSGTAVANLYPAIVEASMEGIPLLVLTADRPYENRNTGANQAIDQVKVFSDSYIRWFRDILPPNDDVPVDVALADADHAVSTAKNLRGPVHLNVQFRENLAPDGGQIRNDNRAGSVTAYDGIKFTDVPGFHRWSNGGGPWQKAFDPRTSVDLETWPTVSEVAGLIQNSKRGIIVVGNLRTPVDDTANDASDELSKSISEFAQLIGFPIFAGIQSGNLRFESDAVIPFAEHILRNPAVAKNLKPDLVIQFGAPLISTEISGVIKRTMSQADLQHILVHPHGPTERADPDFTVTQRISCDIHPFIRSLSRTLASSSDALSISSELAPLVLLGRRLQDVVPSIVSESSNEILKPLLDRPALTEPQVMMSLCEILGGSEDLDISLFLSNSMPVRDAEAFLYPTAGGNTRSKKVLSPNIRRVGVNRGASGIDGIIASATGFAGATDLPTTLVIGDVAALHDINSLHSLKTGMKMKEAQAKKMRPLTTLVLNNDGGGIFSFLPIAKHGNDVSFEDFFGTPTNNVSFRKAAEAFGIAFDHADTIDTFHSVYKSALSGSEPKFIEVEVAPRDINVLVHKEITNRVNAFIDNFLDTRDTQPIDTEDSLKFYRRPSKLASGGKTMVLLHGWMGDKSEWDGVADVLVDRLSAEWSTIVSVDLTGHGASFFQPNSPSRHVLDALSLHHSGSLMEVEESIPIDNIAKKVFEKLGAQGVSSIHALAGYSLGGRVALSMKRQSLAAQSNIEEKTTNMLDDSALVALLSTYPGRMGDELPNQTARRQDEMRLSTDAQTAAEMTAITRRQLISWESCSESSTKEWSHFLNKWYSASIWADLRTKKSEYRSMLSRRVSANVSRGSDHAKVLTTCSPPVCRQDDWRALVPSNTLFLAGELDEKYSTVAGRWKEAESSLRVGLIPTAGHSLLTESYREVGSVLVSFIETDSSSTIQSATTREDSSKLSEQPRKPLEGRGSAKTSAPLLHTTCQVGELDFEEFTISLLGEGQKQSGVSGIGWGESAKHSNKSKERRGFVIQAVSSDGSNVGVGEVSPLPGLHSESFEDAAIQLRSTREALLALKEDDLPTFEADKALSLDGYLAKILADMEQTLSISAFLPSVRAGLEMSLLALASQRMRVPLHQALFQYSGQTQTKSSARMAVLPLNGLATRGSTPSFSERQYASMKVKIGFQDLSEDIKAISGAFKQRIGASESLKIRADANRAYDRLSGVKLVDTMKGYEWFHTDAVEYFEEPLRIEAGRLQDQTWSFLAHVDALEGWYRDTGISYALDESISDIALRSNFIAEDVLSILRSAFEEGPRGCAAFVLKPSVLGLELASRIAKVAMADLGISAVFTSSFDSGVGLSYASFLASLSDSQAVESNVSTFPHGLSTFSILSDDTLSPAFESYVNEKGNLNVASLSRALYGLGLDEIRDLAIEPPEATEAVDSLVQNSSDSALWGDEDYEASTATSSSGREISVVVTLPLPFSADVASSRFTDLPQQPRWSPWISSVAYIDAGSETEWTLKVRGITFSWRATSTLLQSPYKGIQWESVSGLKNTGIVEFIPAEKDSCLMKVRMAIVTPRILSSLFRGTGTSAFFEDFLRNKLLKWSLEMFRDVVKGDLALEEGDVELGDALFRAVEGKAYAIEATLSSASPNKNSDPRSTGTD